MENGDDWFAPDKFQHILFCFSIAVFTSLLASFSRHSLIRRRSIFIGSLASSAAGVAKEFADEFGYFHSAGASAKDAVADLVGVILAVAVLMLWKRLFFRIKPDRSVKEMEVEMV